LVTFAREPSLVHRFAPHVAELPIARRALRDWLAGAPRQANACEELLIVATELCTNAVRHSGSGLVTLRAWDEGDTTVVIEVEGMDNPHEVSAIVRHLDDPYEEGGRGMMIVQTLCDDLSIVVRGRHRLVRCRKSLADA
jgi:anti-sigma regulatory factor (Ser/Thr protein kinase)